MRTLTEDKFLEVAESEWRNPFASIKNYSDIEDYVSLVVQSSNGKSGSDPVSEKSEILFYRAIMTLLFDYGDPHELNPASVVKIADMYNVEEEGEDGVKGPLDLVFEQIETGYKGIPTTENPGDNEYFICKECLLEIVGAIKPQHKTFYKMGPSPLERRDGKRPYDNKKPDGTRGFSAEEDESLRLWHEFKRSMGKALKG